MGSKKSGAPDRAKNGAPQLPGFLAAASLKPFISDDLMVRLVSPLQYRPKHGGRTAFGYDALLLPTICEVLLDASKAGALKANQTQLADMAEILIRGFARVGVIALVDEATGYQGFEPETSWLESLKRTFKSNSDRGRRRFRTSSFDRCIAFMDGPTSRGTRSGRRS
jgi:hypothetical protein